MKHTKRSLALILALGVAISTLPVTAWAADVEELDKADTIVGEEISEGDETSDDAAVGSGDLDAPEDEDAPADLTDETSDDAAVGSGDLDAPEDEDTPADLTDETSDDAPENDNIPSKAPAKAAAVSGTCGENLTWVFDDSTKTLTISGTGAMSDFASETAVPWRSVGYKIAKVEFDGEVTSIGAYAFASCMSLSEIQIPGTVKTIGKEAFELCSKLTSVTISNGVTTIGDFAFTGCDALTSIRLPASVKTIGEGVFPGNVSYSGGEIASSSSLSKITVGSNNKYFKAVDGVLFDKSGQTLICYPAGKQGDTYAIPDSVTGIRAFAFSGCVNLKTITIPQSVTEIGRGAFWECYHLTNIVLPSGVTDIGERTFALCKNLTEITIPGSVSGIGEYAFWNCSALSRVTIEEGVTDIGGRAFLSCNALTDVTIPKSVTSIGIRAFHHTDSDTGAFVPIEGVTISGYTNSFAQTYAKENGIPFIALDQPKTIALATVTLSATKYTYNGTAQKPAVTVKDEKGDALKSGTDYTVSYRNNTNVGTATVTVTGIGGYTGTVSKTFTISAASLSKATVTGISDKTYTGKAITQTPVVKVGSTTLRSGTDYTVSYQNNTNAGTATVTITGKGNYTGTVTKTFKINAAAIANAAVSGISDKTYTGKAITQTPVVKVGSTTLRSGTDYTVSYKNNTNADTATVTITGKGNYTGTVSKTFTISCATPAITNLQSASGGVIINWGKVSGAVKYRVFRRVGSGNWERVADVTDTRAVDRTAQKGTTYTYTVRCISSDSKTYTSSFSSTGWSVKHGTAEPTNLKTPAITNLQNASGGIIINWGKVDGATRYRVFRRIGNGNWERVADVTDTRAVDRTAQKGVTYTYTVRCVSSDGSTYTSSFDSTGKSIKRS